MDKRFVLWSLSVAVIILCGYLGTAFVAKHPQPVRIPVRHMLWRVPLPAATTTLATLSTTTASTTASMSLKSITVAGTTLHVTVADTEAARERGLGGRAGLAPNEGMLFVFQKDGIYSFWMKDMHFSIDMIWISAQGKIVYMAQNVSPSTYPQAFAPTVPARYVLETVAGYAHAHQLSVGDTAHI